MGFYEGEGYTGIHQHHNHKTTKARGRETYLCPMPSISISQKERQVLDLISSFFAARGIRAKVHAKSRGQSFEVKIVGYQSCYKAYKILYPRLRSHRKQEQMRTTMEFCRAHQKTSPNLEPLE